jgi:hypothetical protein
MLLLIYNVILQLDLRKGCMIKSVGFGIVCSLLVLGITDAYEIHKVVRWKVIIIYTLVAERARKLPMLLLYA